MRDRREDVVDVRAEVPVSVRGGDDAFRSYDEARQQQGHSYVIIPPPPLVSSKESYEDGSPSSLEEVQVRYILFGFSAGGFLLFWFIFLLAKTSQIHRLATSSNQRKTALGKKI